jgi:hypothetical protein
LNKGIPATAPSAISKLGKKIDFVATAATTLVYHPSERDG